MAMKTLYHYTDQWGISGIEESGVINPSTNPTYARLGRGVYFTTFDPSNSSLDIASNNWDIGSASARVARGRTDYAVEVRIPQHILVSGHGYRDVYMYPGSMHLKGYQHTIHNRTSGQQTFNAGKSFSCPESKPAPAKTEPTPPKGMFTPSHHQKSPPRIRSPSKPFENIYQFLHSRPVAPTPIPILENPKPTPARKVVPIIETPSQPSHSFSFYSERKPDPARQLENRLDTQPYHPYYKPSPVPQHAHVLSRALHNPERKPDPARQLENRLDTQPYHPYYKPTLTPQHAHRLSRQSSHNPDDKPMSISIPIDDVEPISGEVSLVSRWWNGTISVALRLRDYFRGVYGSISGYRANVKRPRSSSTIGSISQLKTDGFE